jgi:hypothetical protein
MKGLRYGGGETEMILPRNTTYVIRSIEQTKKGDYGAGGNRYVAHVDTIETGRTT